MKEPVNYLQPGKMLAMSLLPLQIIVTAGCYTTQHSAARKMAAVAHVQPLDAIIVPGIPYNGVGWDSIMKARVVWSCLLYKRGIAKNIIFSGGAVYTPWVEAQVMSTYARKLGVPAEHIFMDTVAEHSSENIYYSYLLAKKLGFKSLGLATDPFQSKMLQKFTKKHFGTFIFHLPFVYNQLHEAMQNTHVLISLPLPDSISGFIPLPQRKSLRARFRGTLGKDINWAQYKNKKVDQL